MSVRKIAAALALSLVAGFAQAATVTLSTSVADTAVSPKTTSSFTPANNTLLVAFVEASDTTQATGSFSCNSGGITFTQFATVLFSGAANAVYGFVANSLAPNSSMTCTFDVSSDPSTGNILFVYEVSSMSRTGSSAIKQSKTNSGSAGNTLQVTFDASALTGNPTIGFVGNSSNPAGVSPTTNWTEGADLGYNTPTKGGEGQHRDSGFTGTQIQWGTDSASAWGAIIVELDTSSAVAANFTSGPTWAAASGGHNISGTLNGSGYGALVAYAVGVSPGDGIPSCAQIKAGNNDGDTAALLAANETWTTDVSNNFDMTGSNKIASMDVHVCGSDGTNNTSVTSFSDKLRTARSGFSLVTMASHSAAGICNQDSYFNPDCADGDVFEHESYTDQTSATCTPGTNCCAVIISTAGDLSYSPQAAGVCDNKKTFGISYEDVSSATTGLFTAPTVGNFTTDELVCSGNEAPAPQNTIQASQLYYVGVAISTLHMGDDITDEDDATGTYAVTSGTLPTGITINSSTGDITGTPTVANETGVAIEVTRTDECGATGVSKLFADAAVDMYVTDDAITTPDCVTGGIDAETCLASLDAVRPWLDASQQLIATFAYSGSVAAGDIISQDPLAAATINATDPLEVVVSLGAVGSGRRSKALGIGFGIR